MTVAKGISVFIDDVTFVLTILHVGLLILWIVFCVEII